MRLSVFAAALTAFFSLTASVPAAEPFTVNPQLQKPVRLPTWLQAKRFYVAEVAGDAGGANFRTARSWTSPNPAYLPPGINFNRELKMQEVLWDRDPVQIVRAALVQSLVAGGSIAAEESSADYSLSVSVYRFGLVEATWREYYSKLEMLVQIKNLRTGSIVNAPAIGTCVADLDRKHGQRAIQSGLETALSRGIANFLYNTQTKDAVR